MTGSISKLFRIPANLSYSIQGASANAVKESVYLVTLTPIHRGKGLDSSLHFVQGQNDRRVLLNALVFKHTDRELELLYLSLRESLHIEGYNDGSLSFDEMERRLDDLNLYIQKIESLGIISSPSKGGDNRRQKEWKSPLEKCKRL